ncbi:hypothetical protein C8J57DRAFT_1090289 [Mycena rebaudengoi]|nr:hypothetical protein C8J57DRAFT_1090289 [Mycena rebaudengoi]
MEAWDGDTDKSSAQDFQRAFHRDIHPSTSSADKAKAFKNYFVAGSKVDIWYKGLPTATKADMDLLDAALEARYPEQQTVQLTPAEYGMMLVKEKPKKEELGTKIKVVDREVWAHHAWANKMLRYTTNAKVDKNNTYIEQVRIELPQQIRTKISKMFVNWGAFLREVWEIDTVELEVEMRERREEEETWKNLKQMVERQAAVQASPTAAIRSQLTRTTIGAPAQAPPRWPAPTPSGNPFSSGGNGGQGNLFRAPLPPRTPYEQQQQRPLEGADRAKLLATIAGILQHPNTDAGRREHGMQQHAQFTVHGGVPVSVNTPYPLRPGTVPVNSGECYRCGMTGHTNFRHGCTATQKQSLSVREQTWRRVASQALKQQAIAIRAVGFSSWEVDDYGNPFGGDEGRFEEVGDQGNA